VVFSGGVRVKLGLELLLAIWSRAMPFEEYRKQGIKDFLGFSENAIVAAKQISEGLRT